MVVVNNLSRELNFPYVRGTRPPLVEAGMTKAGPDKDAGTKLKACLTVV